MSQLGALGLTIGLVLVIFGGLYWLNSIEPRDSGAPIDEGHSGDGGSSGTSHGDGPTIGPD